ncbi:MAG: DNA polymerase III subunit beta [Planctomycetaceae bacterium]|nr:DNA polymerase III subunit beta [Planctomycetaceae bacterium]
MKISFARDKFSPAFQHAASVAAKRDVKPILQNVKITADKKTGVLLQATDTEYGIRIQVEECDVYDGGEAILPTTRVKAILAECPDETLTLESTDSKTVISGFRSKWTLETQSPDEFPNVEKFEEKAYHEIQAKSLKEMIRRTTFASDQDNAKYALGGVYFEMLDSSISAVATDGRRMAWQEGSGQSVNEHKVESSILPTKTLQLLERVLQDDENVKVAVSEHRVLFESGNFVFFSRLVEGRFPKWRNIIPNQDSNTSISVMAGALYSAIRQAQITTSEQEPGVFFTFDEGRLELRGSGREIGEGSTEVPITYSGAKQEFKISPKFMTDVLRVLNAETNIELYPPQGTDPFAMKTDDNYQYIVMPLAQ